MFGKALILLSLLALALAKDYTGYKLIETQPLNSQQAKLLQQVKNKWHQYDFHKGPTKSGKAVILTPPEHAQQLEVFLRSHVIKNTVLTDNYEEVLQANKPAPRDSKAPIDPKITFDAYHTYDEIVAYIDGLSGSETWIKTDSIGSTYEGRDLRVIEITKAGAGKPNVFVEAGIHAREWIAPAVATYLIYQLAEMKTQNMNYLDELNFYILPSANPDGYVYSWEEDRLWRTNRVPLPGGVCYGVDLNRNWDYHWDESGTGPACTATYPGESAFSENESSAMRDYYNRLNPPLVVALHAAAELFLYPYGYAKGQYPNNVAEIRTLGQNGVDALNARHGERFQLMNAADLYPAAGASDDWYTSQGARYVYTPELREGPASVFILPPEEILPSGEEMWEAFKVFFDQVIADAKKEQQN